MTATATSTAARTGRESGEGKAQRTLRVGVFLNSMRVEAWEHELLRRVQELEGAEICAVVLNEGGPKYRSKLHKAWSMRSRLGWFAHNALDRRLFRKGRDAFAKVDAEPLLRGLATLSVRPRETRYCDHFEAEDVERIRSLDLDVVIRLGFRILKGDGLKVARHGVWSFHHGDNRENRGGPPGYWEVVEGWPQTGSVLQVLSEDLDGGLVLDRSWSMTLPLSLWGNRNNCYWKSLAMLPRKLNELYRDGPEAFYARAAQQQEPLEAYSQRLFRAPSNARATWNALRQAGKIARFAWNKLTRNRQWFVLWRKSDALDLSMRSFRELVPPPDRFWADPFALERDGSHWIFVEEKPFAAPKAHISVIELDAEGNASPARPVLDLPYHLSYPAVFEAEGQTWMLPETGANRTIELYRCERFPDRWQLARVLMRDVDAVDATLHHDGTRWWLFASLREYAESQHHDELHLWSADSLEAEHWTPHPLNPVVSDVRRARPAGALFEQGGKLYRPSQNCSHHYGYGFQVNEVLKLTPTEYEERTVTSVEPRWDPSIEGTHTLNRAGRLTVVDAYRYRSKRG